MYHITKGIHTSDSLKNGELLQSNLELDTLKNHDQVVKVSIEENGRSLL